MTSTGLSRCGYPRDMTKQHYPVVILLAGLNQDPDDIERLTQFNGLADKNGIIVVYPAALHGRWNMGVRPEEHRMDRWGRVGGLRGGYGRWRLPWRVVEAIQAEVSRGIASPSGTGRAPADDIGFFNQMLDFLGQVFRR